MQLDNDNMRPLKSNPQVKRQERYDATSNRANSVDKRNKRPSRPKYLTPQKQTHLNDSIDNSIGGMYPFN